MHKQSIVVLATSLPGRGSGHIVRSVNLVRSLRARGIHACLHSLENLPSSSFIDRFSALSISDLVCEQCPETQAWSMVLMDAYRCTRRQYTYWRAVAPIVAIDEGGAARPYADMLIDILPSPGFDQKANITSPLLLDLPQQRRAEFSEKRPTPVSVLISFGGEDAKCLTEAVLKVLSNHAEYHISVLPGRLFPKDRLARLKLVAAHLKNCRVLNPIPDLKNHLHVWDVLITQYGLSAFEAVYARIPVLLVSPTVWHQQLAKSQGFISAGIGAKAARHIPGLLHNWEGLVTASEYAAPQSAPLCGTETVSEPIDLSQLLSSFTWPGTRACPVCSSTSHGAALARFPARSYFRCKKCGLMYMRRMSAVPVDYDEDYFFSVYKAQYGKTYLEDFPALVETGRRRANTMLRLCKQTQKEKQTEVAADTSYTLLEIGCAYGPFLTAASEAGFNVYGIDPVSEAINWIREKYEFSVACASFPNFDALGVFHRKRFSALALWYVIEHFPNLDVVLSELNSLLEIGGVLAFSTPNALGISGISRRIDFLQKSPPDHFSIWDTRSAKKVLARYGFKIKYRVVSGHHPERFPGFQGRPLHACIHKMLLFISRFFGLGDTFEVYAVKVRECVRE